jgi:hypothetical protein
VKYPKVEGTCGISPPETLRRVFGDQVAGGTVIKLPAVSPSPSFECAHIVDPSAVARFPAAMVVHPATSVAHHPKQMPSTSGTSGSGTTGHHPMIDPALSTQPGTECCTGPAQPLAVVHTAVAAATLHGHAGPVESGSRDKLSQLVE